MSHPKSRKRLNCSRKSSRSRQNKRNADTKNHKQPRTENLASRRKRNSPRSKALEHLEFLSLLCKARTKAKREKLLDYAHNGEIKAIAECFDNILQGVVPLSDREQKRIVRHLNPIRIVANRGTSIAGKKALLKQRGGFIGSLLPIAISGIAGLLGNLFGRK